MQTGLRLDFLRKRIGSKTWRLVFGFDIHNTLLAIGSIVGCIWKEVYPTLIHLRGGTEICAMGAWMGWRVKNWAGLA